MPISTSHMNLQAYDKLATNRLPSVRTDAVLGWASALLDSHFTRLALGGAVDTAVSSALQALTRTVGGEAECCELLCQVCVVYFARHGEDGVWDQADYT